MYYNNTVPAWAMTEREVSCSKARREEAEGKPIFVEPERWAKGLR